MAGNIEAMLRSENAILRDELASATRYMEMAEAAWLRETSGNSPVAVILTADELAAIENAKTFATNEQTYCVLKKLLKRVAGPHLR